MPRTISHLRGLDDEATQTKLRELATLWSSVRPLPIAVVVRECVRRVHETETSKKKERRR
jgi:hypothetical protein